ncbi:MAG: hypothetical protein WD751_08600 [Anaerolineales bacterium]
MPKSFVELNKVFFEAEFDIYFKYLDSMEAFISTEITHHKNSLGEIERKGELTFSDDPGQMPTEFEYDYYHLDILDQFANIMRRSYFVSLYSSVETTLIDYATYRDQRSCFTPPRQDVLMKTITFLIDSNLTQFSFSKSNAQWQTIRNLGRLRNTIVHNDGRPKDKELVRFINSTNGLSLSSAWVELDYSFCTEATKLSLSFLTSVLFD